MTHQSRRWRIHDVFRTRRPHMLQKLPAVSPRSSFIRRTLTQSGKWLFGVFAGGLAAVILAYVTNFFNAIAPQSLDEFECNIEELFNAPAKDTKFTVLLATLAADTERQHTHIVKRALQGQPGFEVVGTCLVLDINDIGSLSQNIADANKRGRQWLRRWNADLLVWGRVELGRKAINISFLPKNSDSRADGTLEVEKRYMLERELDLEQEFHQDFSTQLVAFALASIVPAPEREAAHIEMLRSLASKLHHLIKPNADSHVSRMRASITPLDLLRWH